LYRWIAESAIDDLPGPETSMILHFVPTEVIVTVAAATLATDTTQLVLVVAVSTLGATAGSLMLYAFARYGGADSWIGTPTSSA